MTHSDRMELLGNLIDAVEDFLESKGITAEDLPCQDRDIAIKDGTPADECAIIYGDDYDFLSRAFEEILIGYGALEKEE